MVGVSGYSESLIFLGGFLGGLTGYLYMNHVWFKDLVLETG